LKVETIQLIASCLCIHYVFIYDEGSTFGVVCDALTNLTDWPKLAKEIEKFLGRYVVAQILDEQSSLDFWCEFTTPIHVSAAVMVFVGVSDRRDDEKRDGWR